MDNNDVETAAFLYSPAVGRHYFACCLRQILTREALGVRDEQYGAEHQQREAELLTCLVNSGDERVTYDLRLVSDPDAELYTRGRLTLALLCRLDGVAAEEAAEHARQLYHLLGAFFDEYVFELAGAGEVERLLRPFSVQHLVAITRRAGRQGLDTLSSVRRRPGLGFTRVEPAAAEVPVAADAVFHVFPFLPTATAFTALFKQLLLQPASIAISVRLRPTALTLAEETFLAEQIARCERAAQLELSVMPENLAPLRPTLREQAQLYQRYQARLLYGLKDNAALMTVELASPRPIPAVVVDHLGTLITEAAGGNRTSGQEALERYLAGGYETVDRRGGPEAAEGFEQMAPTICRHPLAPAGAERLLHLFDSVEAGAAFRLPPATLEEPPGLEAQHWRTQPAPRTLPSQGMLVGTNSHGGVTQPVRIGPEDRRRHVYVVGQTGTGKTTLLKTMILDDMKRGEGLCVVDPHGDLFKELLTKVPEHRIDDVVVLDPTDLEYPVGLNMLEYDTETQRHFLVQEIVGIINRLLQDQYGQEQAARVVGPVFFQHMRMNLLLTMSNPRDPGTFLEFYNIYQEPSYWRRWLPVRIPDPLLDRWVESALPLIDYQKPTSDGMSWGQYLSSKFEEFVFDPMLRSIFGQKRSTLDLRAIMNEGKILLVNLAKGELTEQNAHFLGMVLMARLQATAMGRVHLHEQQRREFHIYVDEFQNIATQSFVTMLSEARKFGISLVLANQFLTQIKDPRIIQAIFGNVGTTIAFRVGQPDAELLEREFLPVFTRFDLANLPNWHACVTTLINGQTVKPFSLQTLRDTAAASDVVAAVVREQSQQVYGRPRAEVEAEISRSLRPVGAGRG